MSSKHIECQEYVAFGCWFRFVSVGFSVGPQNDGWAYLLGFGNSAIHLALARTMHCSTFITPCHTQHQLNSKRTASTQPRHSLSIQPTLQLHAHLYPHAVQSRKQIRDAERHSQSSLVYADVCEATIRPATPARSAVHEAALSQITTISKPTGMLKTTAGR